MLEQIVIPFLIYEILIGFFSSFFPMLGTVEAVTAGNLSAIVVLTYLVKKSGNLQKVSLCWQQREHLPRLLMYLAAGGISFSIALNNMIFISGLPELFPAVSEVQENIYTPVLWLQMIGIGMIVPIAEELVYRGIFYGSLKQHVGINMAMTGSALIFGVMHGNMVQGLYAGLTGLFLAWVYETCGSILAPVVVHIAANMTSVLGTYWLEQQEDICRGISFYMVTAMMAVAAVWAAVKIKKNQNKSGQNKN